MTEAKLKPKSVDGARPQGGETLRQAEASAVEVAPPEGIEPDPDLTPKDLGARDSCDIPRVKPEDRNDGG